MEVVLVVQSWFNRFKSWMSTKVNMVQTSDMILIIAKMTTLKEVIRILSEQTMPIAPPSSLPLPLITNLMVDVDI